MAKVPFWHLVCSVIKEDDLLARTRESQRESDAICPRFHGARCGAVSRHPAQALDVRGWVPGGAAQSSSQPACPASLQCCAGGWQTLPWTPRITQRISIACQLNIPPDALLRRPRFPSEIAPGVTARQPNSESLTAAPVAAVRRDSPCLGRWLSSGGDPTLRAPAPPVPAATGKRSWRSGEGVPGPAPLLGASSSLFQASLCYPLS